MDLEAYYKKSIQIGDVVIVAKYTTEPDFYSDTDHYIGVVKGTFYGVWAEVEVDSVAHFTIYRKLEKLTKAPPELAI